jgi:hypothetical protein
MKKRSPYKALLLFVAIESLSFLVQKSRRKEASTRYEKLNNRPDPSHQNKLLLLHYHKTGHQLSRMLDLAGFGVPLMKKSMFHRNKMSKAKKKLLKAQQLSNNETANAMIVSAVILDFDTDDDWLLEHTKLVHFVRNPFDWCLSAYLYHQQRPLPHMEIKWLDEEEKDPCGYYGMYPPNELCRNSAEPSKASLEQFRKLCLDLVNEASLHNNTASTTATVVVEACGPSSRDSLLLTVCAWKRQEGFWVQDTATS